MIYDVPNIDHTSPETVARRSRLAGRQLSLSEITKGIKKPDTRTVAQKVADEQWQPVLDPVGSTIDPNPFRRPDIAEAFAPRRKLSRKDVLKNAERAFDEKEKQKAERDAFMSERRKAAIDHAVEALELATFSDLPFEEVIEAKKRLRQAQAGSLDHYKAMDREFRERLKERKDKRLAEIEEAKAVLDRVADDVAREFEPEPEPKAEPERNPETGRTIRWTPGAAKAAGYTGPNVID